MNKKFTIQVIFLLAVILGLCNCYDDKGNYDYKELTSLSIDTTGIKPQQTAYQFENFKVPVEVKYAGNIEDLSYEWKIYPQTPTKDDNVSYYDSAVVLYTKAVFDTVIYEVPGAYYLTLTVTDQVQNIKEFFTMAVNVETLVSRGLCVMDETNGIYDLHLIKSSKILTDITESEEHIYYHIYSGVNDLEVTDGKFLGRGTHSANNFVFFFTETGGLKLDVNTYEIKSSDFTSWFSLPMSITPAPSAYMVNSRPMEMIVNNGLIYKWDHMTMGTTSFGDRLDGDYEAAPYLPMLTGSFSTVIFDMKNKRFAPINQFGSQVGEFDSTAGAEFDLNDIGASKELKYMDNGFNSYTYAVFYDTQTSGYSLYVMDITGDTPTPVKIYSMSNCEGINDNSCYAFGHLGNVCFYSSGSDLCQYRYASTNVGSVVHSFSGETITGVKVFKKTGHAEDGKLLIVSTVTGGGEGKIYLINFNELTGAIISGTNNPYTGFGRVVDVMYKE